MFEPYTQEAMLMVEEGASPSAVDAIMGPRNFGMAMGPLAVFDLAGNDIGYRIRKESYYPHTPEQVTGSRGGTWNVLADSLCELGRHGQKTGKGWYDYEGRAAVESEEVKQLALDHARKYSIAPVSHSEEDIMVRCLYTMVNEGFKILEEGVAVRASDIDVVWNYGYGFPRIRGGPMHYGDQVVGLEKLRDSLLMQLDKQPELPEWHFKPSALLNDLVASKTTLAEYEMSRK